MITDNRKLIKLTFALICLSFALLTPNVIEQQSRKNYKLIYHYCQIIVNNTNDNVGLVLKTHFYVIIKSLNLIENRVLHTMTGILCTLYMFYVTVMTLKSTSVLISPIVHMK